MKIAIRAAIAALSIASIGSAYAGDGEGLAANTQFTEIPGVIAQAPAQNAPVFANAQNGQALHAYVGHCHVNFGRTTRGIVPRPCADHVVCWAHVS